MERKRGFYVTRNLRPGRRSLSLSLSLSLWCWAAALLALLLIVGATRAWSQSSGSSSSSSSDDLKTWETLSARFKTGLDEQSTRLQQALTETLTSKPSLEKLTRLLEQSSKANADLRNYNAQIAQRMQDRDEELAAAWDEIDRKDRLILKLIIALVAAAAAGVILLIIFIRR